MAARIFCSFLQLCRWNSWERQCTVKAEPAEAPIRVSVRRGHQMIKGTQLALNDAAEWLGDWHPLAEQLGSTDGLLTLASVSSELRQPPVHDLVSLERALRQYQARILLPFELPAIQAAHGHTARNELRELIALDQGLQYQPILQRFAMASRRVGQGQLQKLRPLHDQRFVRRYLHAVEIGLAHGWHTLVYGLTLEIYSLALRQGLLGYAHQTTRGFIYSAARMLQLSERQCRDLFERLCVGLPEAVDGLLAHNKYSMSVAQ